jgi:hypothetical protein
MFDLWNAARNRAFALPSQSRFTNRTVTVIETYGAKYATSG